MSLRRYSETVIRSVNINEFLIVACGSFAATGVRVVG